MIKLQDDLHRMHANHHRMHNCKLLVVRLGAKIRSGNSYEVDNILKNNRMKGRAARPNVAIGQEDVEAIHLPLGSILC